MPWCRSYIALTQSGWSANSDSKRYVFLPRDPDVGRVFTLVSWCRSKRSARRETRLTPSFCVLRGRREEYFDMVWGRFFLYLIRTYYRGISPCLYVLTCCTSLPFGGAGFHMLQKGLGRARDCCLQMLYESGILKRCSMRACRSRLPCFNS